MSAERLAVVLGAEPSELADGPTQGEVGRMNRVSDGRGCVVVGRAWEPPGGLARAMGGLLGAAVGADGLAPDPLVGGASYANPPDAPEAPVSVNGSGGCELGSVGAALLDVAKGYARGEVPLAAAEAHVGVHGPAWLLPVALVRREADTRVSDALELATAAGVEVGLLEGYVAYVDVAAALFAGRPPQDAIHSTVSPVPVSDGELSLCGDTTVDALVAGSWALEKASRESLAEQSRIQVLVEPIACQSTPGVVAAVAGLLGLLAGVGAWPLEWHRHHAAASCRELAALLVRARCRRGLTRPSRHRSTRAGVGP